MVGGLDELHYENAQRQKIIRNGPLGLGIVGTLNVPDLDKVYKAAIKNNLTILLEPVEEYYGDRVFMFFDKDGYEWKISQTVKQVDLEEIKNITSNY